MKKRVIIGLVVFVLFFPIIGFGAQTEGGFESFEDDSLTFDPDDPDSFDWQKGDLSTVPSDKLDPSKIKQFNREKDLILDHLIHKNTDSTYNLDKFDLNKLNENIRDEALEKLGRTKEVQSKTGNLNTQITSFDDGWEIDKILLLTIDDIHIVNGQGIAYRDNKLSIVHAETLYTQHGILFSVNNFTGTSIEFDVGSVNQVQDGCISLYDLENSHLTSNDHTLEISPSKPTTFSIKDCFKTETQYEGFGQNSKITISKEHSYYDISKGRLTCENLDKSTDVLTANSTASLEMGDSCFGCMTIQPVGTYWHRSEKVISDFGVKIPQDMNAYRLCLRKLPGDPLPKYDGLFDFPAKAINLTGKVEYLRMPFKLQEGGLFNYILLPPYTPQPVYEGFDSNNRVEMQLDNDLVYIDNFYFENDDPREETLAKTYSGYHTLVEAYTDDRFRRYETFRKKPFSPVVRGYSSKHILPRVWINSSLIQENTKIPSRVVIHEPTPEVIGELVELLRETKKRHRLS